MDRRVALAVLAGVTGCKFADVPPLEDVDAPGVDAPARGTVVIDSPSSADGRLFVHGADGVVTRSLTLDATGHAEVELDAGDGLTWEFLEDFLVTFAAVQPGDHLDFRPCNEPVTRVAGVQLEVRVAPHPTASVLRLYTGCHQWTDVLPATVNNVTVPQYCTAPSMDFMVLALDSEMDVVGWQEARVAVTSGTSTVDFVSGWNDALRAVPFALTDAPAGATGLDVEVSRPAPQGRPLIWLDDRHVVGQGSDVDATVRFPHLGPIDYRVILRGTGGDAISASEWTGASQAPGAVSLDLTDGLLPLLTSAAVDVSTPARPTISWTAARPLDGADRHESSLSWTVAGGRTQSWVAVGPPSATSATFPALPVDVVDPASATAPPTASAYLLDRPDWNGYDHSRTVGCDASTGVRQQRYTSRNSP